MAVIDTHLAELTERLELLEVMEAQERELARRAARVDDSAAGMRRQNHVLKTARAVHAAQAELRRLQKARPANFGEPEEPAAEETEAHERFEATAGGGGDVYRRKCYGRSHCDASRGGETG